MTEAEEKAVEYLKANSLVRLNENNEVVAYGNAHKYYIINLIEKLKKENEEYKLLNANIEKANRIIEGKEEYIPKDKIRNCINEYEKEIKTYENKMLEITQKEKHFAIENEDYIRYSCIISNFTDKIKLLEELLEEE